MEAAEEIERPPNRTRAIFHVGAALFCLVLTLVVFTPQQLPWAAAAFAGTAWSLEAIRRIWPSTNEHLMKFFRGVAHPSERHRVNSSTWYMTALVPLAATGSTILCVIGLAVLGFGDPAAAFVGRRWGRIQIGGRRTLEGTFAFVGVAATASFGFVQVLGTPPAMPIALGASAVAALTGAATELVSRRVDDNFSIPLAAAAAAAVALTLAGHPLP
jgi:dolichol kinase